MIQFSRDRQHPRNDEWPAVLPVHQISSFLLKKHLSLPGSMKAHGVEMKWLFWTIYFFSLALKFKLGYLHKQSSKPILHFVDNGPSLYIYLIRYAKLAIILHSLLQPAGILGLWSAVKLVKENLLRMVGALHHAFAFFLLLFLSCRLASTDVRAVGVKELCRCIFECHPASSHYRATCLLNCSMNIWHILTSSSNKWSADRMMTLGLPVNLFKDTILKLLPH